MNTKENYVTYTVYMLPEGTITPRVRYVKLDQIEARAAVKFHTKRDNCHHFMVIDEEFTII